MTRSQALAAFRARIRWGANAETPTRRKALPPRDVWWWLARAKPAEVALESR